MHMYLLLLNGIENIQMISEYYEKVETFNLGNIEIWYGQ